MKDAHNAVEDATYLRRLMEHFNISYDTFARHTFLMENVLLTVSQMMKSKASLGLSSATAEWQIFITKYGNEDSQFWSFS